MGLFRSRRKKHLCCSGASASPWTGGAPYVSFCLQQRQTEVSHSYLRGLQPSDVVI